MQCGNFIILLSKSLDQELRMEERLALRDHLSACRACRNEKSEFERVHTLISSVLKGMRASRKIRPRLVELLGQFASVAVSAEAPQENPAPPPTTEVAPTSAPETSPPPAPEIAPFPAPIISSSLPEAPSEVKPKNKKVVPSKTFAKSGAPQKDIQVADQLNFMFEEEEATSETVGEIEETMAPAQSNIEVQEISTPIIEPPREIFVEEESPADEPPALIVSDYEGQKDSGPAVEVKSSAETIPEPEYVIQDAKPAVVLESADVPSAAPFEKADVPAEKNVAEIPASEISPTIAAIETPPIISPENETKKESFPDVLPADEDFAPSVEETPSRVEYFASAIKDNYFVQAWRRFSEDYRLTATYITALFIGLMFLFFASFTKMNADRLSVNITIKQTAGAEIVLRFSHPVDTNVLTQMCRLQNKKSKEVWPLQVVALTTGEERIFNLVPDKPLPPDSSWKLTISSLLTDRGGDIIMERRAVKEFSIGK